MNKPDQSSLGNQDQKEKNRKLSEAEKKRHERFEANSDALIRQGYRRVDLTVSIRKANAFAVGLLIPLLIIGIAVLYLKHGGTGTDYDPLDILWFFVAYLVLIPVHELIHGASWAIFAEHHFKDIEFGFMKQYLTPYCTCSVPLEKGPYIFGALMPLIILGIIPMIIGIATGSLLILSIGILMTDAAAGDILIVWKLLRYKSEASNTVFMDHPTQAGGVVFKK